MGRLFKSKKERERDDRRERRRAFRKAENAVDDVKDRIREMEKKAKVQWDGAREALAEGRKAASSRLLTSYRAAQVLMVKLEQKRWVFEQHIEKLRAAESDTEFANALAKINDIMQIDPDKVIDTFDDSAELLSEQGDADRAWNKLYEKEMEGAGDDLQDHIPSMDDLAAQLEAEAGAGTGAASEAPAAKADSGLDGRIASGRQRVDSILKGGDKPS
jgi:hypothetical protein